MPAAEMGFFIVLDGIDGCGKTVHSKILCEALRKLRYDVAYTTEPSESMIGSFIEQKLLREAKVAPEVEALLFAADRFEHLKFDVLPMLNANKIVVSDRYVYSSIAYQGAQGLRLDWLRQVNYFAIKPNLALYLDVPPEVGLARKRGRSVLENLQLETKVRQVYIGLVHSGEMIKVDSNRSLNMVKEEILTLALQALEKANFPKQNIEDPR